MVVGFTLTVVQGRWSERLVTAGVQCLIWTAGVAFGNALGGPALTALGPRVAVGRGVLIGLVDSAAASAWFPGQRLSVGATFLLAAIVFTAAAEWETLSLRHVVPAVRLLLVGTSVGARNLIEDLQIGRGGGYELVGVVEDHQREETEFAGAPLLGNVAQLPSVVEAHLPDLVVLGPSASRPQVLLRLLDAAAAGFRVVELTEFYEYAYGRVPVEDLPREWFLSVLHLYQRPYSRFTKRTLDIVGAGLLLLLTLPLFPLVAMLVHRTPGPVILRQVRLGEHGRPFTIFKFRTMRADAEADGSAVWAVDHDPRLTPVGSVLRRFRIDELPQLWNVLRGEMSLVGPRPERPEFLGELAACVPYWTRRLLVKPGLTGWAQVRQGYAASAEATAYKLSYDFWYLRHRSLMVDLAVLLRTLAVVLRGDVSAAPWAATPAAPAVAAHVGEPVD